VLWQYKESQKSSSKKKPSSTKTPEKSTDDKPAESSGYKSNAQGNATGKKEEVKRPGMVATWELCSLPQPPQFDFLQTLLTSYLIPSQLALSERSIITSRMISTEPIAHLASAQLSSPDGNRYECGNATHLCSGIFLQAEYEHATISSPYDEFEHKQRKW
jgi:hypothetical protein